MRVALERSPGRVDRQPLGRDHVRIGEQGIELPECAGMIPDGDLDPGQHVPAIGDVGVVVARGARDRTGVLPLTDGRGVRAL